jgi:hypothetical protein
VYEHEVALTSLTSSKTVIGKGSDLLVDAEMANLGRSPEEFNLTVDVNETSLTNTPVNLLPGETESFTVTWNTSTVSYGNYTIAAVVQIVMNETLTTNNQLRVGPVMVTIIGDVNGDFIVQIVDLVLLARAYGSKEDNIRWNPNADLNGSGVIDIADVAISASHFGSDVRYLTDGY